MSSRWKKVWADFWGNKTRTTITILTIAVGVFAVGFNTNMTLFVNHDMDADFLSANPSETRIYAAPMDDDHVKMASEIPGVGEVEGLTQLDAQFELTEDRFVTIQFTAVESPGELTVNALKPAEVSELSLPLLGEKEVLFDRSASVLGIKPGQIISVELSDGKRRELRLAGYIHDVAWFPYWAGNSVNAYVTPDTMEWLGGSSDYTQLAISVAEDPSDQKHVEAVAQAVSDRLERSGSTVYYVFVYQPGHHFAWSVTQGVMFILAVLGWMTVLLSGVLIINTITSLMTQQTRQIGIMKATGGGISQIAGMYIVLILIFGLTALAISIPLAGWLGYVTSGGLADYLNFDLSPFRFYPEAIFQQAVVALIVPLLAALYPIIRGVRLTVREALSDYGLGGNAKPRNAEVNKSAVSLPRPIRISLRNAFRRKARLLLTLSTLVLGGAIFIAVFNLRSSFAKTMEDIEGYFLADINVGFGRAYRFERVASLAESIPGVESVEGWAEIPGTLASEVEDEAGTQIMFVAPPSSSDLIKPIMTYGRWLTPADENAVVIGNHLINVFPDLKVGDWLTIKINEKETDWHIIGIYQMTGNVSPPIIYTNYEYISRLTNETGQVYSLRIITREHDALSQQSAGDQLRSVFDERGIQVSSTTLSKEWAEQQREQTDILVYFMLIMAVLIAIVGGLGLMGTMSINVLERTREIGVMRAIGASNADIQGIVVVEGLAIGVISWIISILIAIPITSVLCIGVGSAIMNGPMPVVLGGAGIIIWLVGILFIGTIASLLPARRASRLTVRDTLAYE